MDIIIGFRVLVDITNQHRFVVRKLMLDWWEKFIDDLAENYERKNKERIIVDTYVTRVSEKNQFYYLFEYIIPLKLIDFYGRVSFREVLPTGSQVDIALPI